MIHSTSPLLQVAAAPGSRTECGIPLATHWALDRTLNEPNQRVSDDLSTTALSGLSVKVEADKALLQAVARSGSHHEPARPSQEAIAACYALGQVAKPLVPDVAKALQHLDIQPFAGEWLGKLGPNAEGAIPALIEILKDKKNPTRCLAALNLAHIAIHRPQDVLPVLNECLKEIGQPCES